MTTDTLKTDSLYRKLGVIGIISTWIVTIGSFVWYVAITNTNYSLRLTRVEQDIIGLDERLDVSEAYRMQIQTDLAQIKTDLLWIRRTLEQNP